MLLTVLLKLNKNIERICNMIRKTITNSISLLLVLTCFLIESGYAQKKLTYKQVFENAKPRILERIPDIESWLDSEHYLQWIPEGRYRKARLQKINAKDGIASIQVDFSQVNQKFSKGIFFNPWQSRTDDYKEFIINFNEDLYYFSNADEKIRQLTNTPASEKNAHFSPDGSKIAFTREHNLYILDVASGIEKKLTHDGSDVIYNGWASWVYYEEILGRSSRYKAFWWAPNSEMIAFLHFDDSHVPQFHLVHTDSIHDKLEIQRYPKAGDPNPSVKLGIIHLKEEKTVWVDLEENADHYVAWPFWTKDSRELLFQWINRSQETIRIYGVDPFKGNKRKIYEETQSKWVEFFEDLYIFKDGSGFLLRSDRDGWRHLYLYNMDGKPIERLTRGEWYVDDILSVDENKRVVYFHGSIEKSTEKHLYVIGLNGKGLKKLTNSVGTHKTRISPGCDYFIDNYSNIYQPTKIDLCNVNGNMLRQLGNRESPALKDYDLGTVEIFTIPTTDGHILPALWVLPPAFSKTKKYPVIFRVYGGPDRARVSNSFQAFSDHFYAQQGIIIMNVDHRGSKHFGKKGASLMHRNLGKWEIHDLIEAVKWLRKLPFIDYNRIGISGTSYGGYVGCLALTLGSDYFTHAFAGFSVTDWRLYDTMYTERYMDKPEENMEGYKFGSVMTHVDKFKGNLLLTHGSLDDNVHMQNTLQLVDALERENKKFELIIYPGQRHGFRGYHRKHSTHSVVDFWFRHYLGKELDVDAE